MKLAHIILAAVIFLAVVFTGTLSAANHDHDCIGSECPVCLIIEAGSNFHNALKLTGVLFFTAAITAAVCIFFLIPQVRAFSPVALKVRFNS